MKQTMALMEFMMNTCTSMIEAIGIIDQLHELEKSGKIIQDTPISFLSAFLREPLKRVQSMNLIQNYSQYKLNQMSEQKSEYNKNYFQKKKLLKERERDGVPSSPSSPTPLSPPISPSEKEREITPCHTSYDIPLKGKDSQTKTRRSFPEYSDEFNAFWAVYPRKVAKTMAWKAWKTLNPDEDTQNAIKTDINRRIEHEWRGKDMTYIPHPATYLNQQRWEDETEVTRVAKPERTDEDLFAGLTPEEIAIVEQLANDGEHWG